MAYGQTGTGKTFTLGRLGDEDTSSRGIMVRSMEDILADVSLESDSVSVSYLQVVRPLSCNCTFLVIYRFLIIYYLFVFKCTSNLTFSFFCNLFRSFYNLMLSFT